MRDLRIDIPVVAEADVVIAGGSTWAVSAAIAAREAQARVFLAAPRPYLGEDLCATLRLEMEAGQTPQTPLAERIFASGRATTPLHVKQVLDQALSDAGVEFLLGCYATDLLRDPDGLPCGIVIANRAGRQAVIARIVIDATWSGSLAALGGAQRHAASERLVQCERTVLVPREPEGAESVRHELTLSLGDGDFPALCAAEQGARDRTYTEGQLRAAESLFVVPPAPIVCETPAKNWKGGDKPDLEQFRPKGLPHVYVLSGAADIPRDAAGELLRPTGLMKLGEQVGRAAAREAAELPAPERSRVARSDSGDSGGLEIRELLQGPRPSQRPEQTVPAPADGAPVLGRFDVVVVGGGTSGAAAAIGAGRQGARVLVIEYQEALGGTSTLGLIGKPYHGQRRGFSEEVPFPDGEHNLEYKMEWLRREIRDAGGEIWLGALACGAVVRGEKVCGVVVVSEHGRGLALGEVVIDATGNADVAVAAGAEYLSGATEDGIVAWQGAGLPRRPLRSDYVNTDYLLLDESDVIDASRALRGARATMADSYDAGSLLQSRERRRIVGEHVLSYLDEIAGRTYGDSIVHSASDYDSHGYPNEPYFALIPHDDETRTRNHPAPGGACFTPYRCLIPRGLDGILVTGLGISMKRDASAMVRMQYDLSNQGYAAGVAAAMVVRAGVGPREVDIAALQEHLVETGALPSEVRRHQDNFPLSQSTVAKAAQVVGSADRDEALRALAIVLSHSETSLPMLRDAFDGAIGEAKLAYARILGTLGDARGVDVLIEALRGAQWDAKILQGRMAEYAHLPTPVDSLVLALGFAGDPRGLPPILDKVEQLSAETTLSHHRAVAEALERLADPAAAPSLARLLHRPGMSGHTMTTPEPLHDQPREKRRREAALREITLARALYACGDHEQLGESILRRYTEDLRAVLAQHATAVLTRETTMRR
jgi:FAD-dependent oxidoreductase family protein